MNTSALYRILSALLLAGAPLAASLSAQAVNYTVTDLGRLPGAYTTVPWGMNNQGAVVGWCQGPATDTRAFLWTPAGGIVELPQFPGIVQNAAYAISDSGVIVGAGRMSLSGPQLPWRLMNGVLQAIPILPVSPGAMPRGVNDAGQVVGWTTDADPFQPVTHAFFWSDATGLIDITGGEASARAINNQGVVVGSVAVGTTGRVFSWTLAGGIQIFAPLSTTCSDGAFAINELGQITAGNTCGGGSGTSSVGTQAYLYTPGSGMQQILPLAGSYTYGVDLNGSGDIVSTIRISQSGHRPWIYTSQGGQQYLDTQIDPAAGYFMDTAIAIDDSGRIVGSASSSLYFPDSFPRAIVLTPLASGASFCSGDGSGTACPCGNAGAAGNGCANSVNANGANLSATGTASIAADTLVLHGTGMPDSSALYFQGTTQQNGGLGALFGDGLRCAGGNIIRLGTRSNVAGSSQYPGGGDPSVSVRGSCAAGDVRTYQVWYRNAAAFCTASTFNLSNGLSLTWAP